MTLRLSRKEASAVIWLMNHSLFDPVRRRTITVQAWDSTPDEKHWKLWMEGQEKVGGGGGGLFADWTRGGGRGGCLLTEPEVGGGRGGVCRGVLAADVEGGYLQLIGGGEGSRGGTCSWCGGYLQLMWGGGALAADGGRGVFAADGEYLKLMGGGGYL